MKKTEKIEVRLSHEEKTALTTMAEQEDRSVSELVRGLIERYMSINTTRLPRKTPWLIFGAIAVGSFFLGHIGTYLIAKSHQHAPVHSMSVKVGQEGISFPVLAEAGQNSEFVIPSSDGDILIKTKTKKLPKSLATVSIELCRQATNSCETIATPSLKFDPDRISAVNFKEKDDKGVFISLSPPQRRGG